MKPTLILAFPEADNLPFAIVSSISVFVMVSRRGVCTYENKGEKNSGLAFLTTLIYTEIKTIVLIRMILATKWGSIIVWKLIFKFLQRDSYLKANCHVNMPYFGIF